jgi:cytochrome c556
MRKILWLVASSLIAVGSAAAADHTYAKIATPHDLMAGAVKPNMDRLAEMRKAGGPKEIDEWKQANASASVIGEVNQLMLLDGRIKDQAWEDGATKVIEAAKATMTAAMRQDMNGFNSGLDGMSQGCRTCHKVHKPKK